MNPTSQLAARLFREFEVDGQRFLAKFIANSSPSVYVYAPDGSLGDQLPMLSIPILGVVGGADRDPSTRVVRTFQVANVSPAGGFTLVVARKGSKDFFRVTPSASEPTFVSIDFGRLNKDMRLQIFFSRLQIAKEIIKRGWVDELL
jgi:hypothetical protein